MKITRSILFVVLAVTLLSSVGCRKSQTLPEEIAALLADNSGKVVRLGVYGDPLGLNPIQHIESEHGQMVNNFVHASPLRKLDDGSFVPYLFSEYYLTPGENGTVVLDAIWRRGLKWHDGTDFDPRALEYTIRAMRDPANGSPYADLARGVLSVSALGQGQRCHMVFASNSRQYLDLLCVGLLPAHILNGYPYREAAGLASESATARVETENKLASYTEKPVGLGPYLIKSRESGSYVLLEANPHFFDDRVASRPQVLVHSSYEFQQLISDFRQKKYDWINLPSMISEQLESMNLEQVKFVKYPNHAGMVWMFNTRAPLLTDVRVRKALDLLADRGKIKNQFSADGEVLYNSPLASPPAAVADYEARFAEAIKLLDEAGLVDANNDGWRDFNGNTIELPILINDDNLTRRVIADQIIADLARAKIKATVDAVSWADFVAKRLRPGEYATALLSLQLPAAANWVSLLHSSPRVLENLNFSGIADPEIDQALTTLDSMHANAQRDEAIATLAARLEETRPMAFLFRPLDVGLYHAEAGRATAACQIWNDVLNWKLLFGPPESKF